MSTTNYADKDDADALLNLYLDALMNGEEYDVHKYFNLYIEARVRSFLKSGSETKSK